MTGTKSCQRCGTTFTCDIARGEKRCWCFDLPNVLPVDPKKDCLCPDCLKKEIAQFTASASPKPTPGTHTHE